ncbi:MAG TPA: alkylhydroperoxidase [Bacteroidetes bacterium]|nr:alkylhydroperoxidase [Bacteroidota bacterium]
MTWIKTIPYREADPKLKKIYDRVKSPDGQIDNILLAHSLRPHTLTGHMALYKNVLHHFHNTLPKWYLETIGVLVSLLNKCDYCVQHHFHGLKRLLQNDARADEIYAVLQSGHYSKIFEGKYYAGLRYAKELTLLPHAIDENNMDLLRNAGLTDGQILEINQVTAYFNYANRTVLGLGVSTGNEVLGLSPGDDDNEKNWVHA